MIRVSVAIVSALFFSGCLTTNISTPTQEEIPTAQIEDDDEIAVCGEIDGEKRTYPTLGDLKAEGAKLLYYGPCDY